MKPIKLLVGVNLVLPLIALADVKLCVHNHSGTEISVGIQEKYNNNATVPAGGSACTPHSIGSTQPIHVYNKGGCPSATGCKIINSPCKIVFTSTFNRDYLQCNNNKIHMSSAFKSESSSPNLKLQYSQVPGAFGGLQQVDVSVGDTWGQ